MTDQEIAAVTTDFLNSGHRAPKDTLGKLGDDFFDEYLEREKEYLLTKTGLP